MQNAQFDRKQQPKPTKQKGVYQDQEPTAVEKRLLCTATSELLQEVLDGETTVDSTQLANQRNSCPELYQVQKLLSQDDNQINKNCMERLMMLNTTTITSAIIETDSSEEIASSSSEEKTSSEKIITDNLIQSRSSKQDNQFKKDHHKAHDKQLSGEQYHVRRRMVKAMSQVEPLSLIEKVREIRFAVQRSLDAAESKGQFRQKTSSSKQQQQKSRKKRKEQAISSRIKSSPSSDHSHLSSFYNHQNQQQQPHLPLLSKDQIIHPSSDTHHSIKSIHQYSSSFETQENYANDQLDYNLNFKDFKLKEDEPLSCDHRTSNSSSSSSSPSTMLGRAPVPKTSKGKTKHDYSRKASGKQLKEEKINEENVCSSAKKQRKSLHQQQPSYQPTAVCNRHPFAVKRRAASLDQLQFGNQLCTCSKHRTPGLDFQLHQPMQLSNITNTTNPDNISMIYRGPFQQQTNLPDSSIHFINPNRLTTSVTSYSIISHHVDSSTDRNQQNSTNRFLDSRLPMTRNECTFSSSPSIIKCDIVEYL